ncbi:type II toxin-antitoxin system RelE/ParE family toxin [Candidatus Kaiserbacteria bacterium]|nr:type II toxin-antitoxin system RelE/ParE family toxin [Candidatus Kaiserbacteria bacterium]
MGYRLRFKREALAQLDRLYGYILDRDLAAARKILAETHAIFRHLKKFPRLGHSTDEPSVRCFIVARTGLLIFYTLEEKVIIIIRILHERQNRT